MRIVSTVSAASLLLLGWTQSAAGSMILYVAEDESVAQNRPDKNYHASTFGGGSGVGRSGGQGDGPFMTGTNWSVGLTRSYLKFDLSGLSDSVPVVSATMNLYLSAELYLADRPIGVYLGV